MVVLIVQHKSREQSSLASYVFFFLHICKQQYLQKGYGLTFDGQMIPNLLGSGLSTVRQ